jgi:hypothetical protein
VEKPSVDKMMKIQTRLEVLRRHLIMRLVRFDIGVFVAMAIVLSAQVAPAQTTAPWGIGGYIWLDANDEPLPFQGHTEIQEALLSARVVSREKVGRGVAGVEKVLLDYEGLRFHGAFRSVDVTKRKTAPRGIEKPNKKYRDAAIFESAAYELSELLDLGRVPPVVVRTIDDQDGTLQIWMEDIRPEVELIQSHQLDPPDKLRWLQQKQIMIAFDNLIANSDRNQGNILIDGSWNIWFIDHTRAFKRTSTLIYRAKMSHCERGLWERLREIDEDTLRRRLEPYLESQEISKLITRRRQLVRHVESLIRKNGESAVLYDLRPPAGEKASWSD